MSYRKFRADYLFDGYRLLNSGEVLVTDDEGTILEIIPPEDAGEGVERLNGLVCPGFINCHSHLELSHLKGRIPMKTGLVDFVLSIVGQRKAPPEEISSAIATAEKEMLTGGIMAAGDICNTADTLNQKSGRRLAYYNFIELAGWLPGLAQKRFDAGKVLYESFEKMAGNTDHLSLNPHAPYSVSPGLWDLLRTGFQHKTITIHNQETAAENEFFISGRGGLTRMYEMMKISNIHFSATGTRSLPHYMYQFHDAKNILLVHNTFTPEEDLTMAVSFSNNLFFCLCPNANLYIEDRLPDIPSMIRLGGNLLIGTDSLASNHQLSVLEEMKTIRKYFPLIPVESLLQWATSNGARALQFEQELGDFTKGKKPGIVLIEYKEKDLLGSDSRCRRIL